MAFSLQLPSPQPTCLFFYESTRHCSPSSLSHFQKTKFFPISLRLSSSRIKCLTKSAAAEEESSLVSDDAEEEIRDDTKIQLQQKLRITNTTSPYGASLSLGIREPVYEVVEVKVNGMVSAWNINRS